MRNLIIILIACFLLYLVGCSNQTTKPDQADNYLPVAEEVPPDINEFLNKYIFSEDEEEWYQYLAGLDSIPEELIDNCDIYAVTFLWGQFFDETPDLDTTDWSGTLSINGESVVHVRNMIDFEPGQDSVLIHDNPTFAAWLSYTTGDFDGLSFLLFLRNDIVYITPPFLRFETPQTTLDFSFYELAQLDAFYQIDNLNGVAVHSRRLWHHTCPGGLIEGRWIKDGSFSGSGSFNGYWMDQLGNPIGYLNGIFWTNEDFTRQFSGSVSGLVTDEVIAELQGSWFFDDPRMCPVCGEGHGQFMGTFTYVQNDKTGIVAGEFGDYSLPPDDQDMPFVGIWKVNCPWFDVSNDMD